MANINKELNKIKNAVYGREVRGSIHDGIDKINKETEIATGKADEAHGVMESIINDGFDNAALEANFEQKLDDKINNLQPEWTQFKDQTNQQLAETAKQTKVLTDASRFKESDIELLHNFLSSGEGIRYAALGDSTVVGIRNGEEPYGELRNIMNYSGQTLFALSLMINDDNFIPLSDRVYDVKKPNADSSSASAAPIESHRLIVSDQPKLHYEIRQQHMIYDELTIYYLERTHDRAALFDIKISSLNDTTSHVVDTYVDPVSFNGSARNVDLRLQSKTLSIPNDRDLTIDIDNVRLADRGNGVETNGTAIIVGFALGKGVKFMNYAVSSTTLLDDSSANITRGVTTDERFQKAFSFGANVIGIGFGTNDSKNGVSTPEAFKYDLENRIDEIRDNNPNTVIILNTAPPGIGEYQNNVIFNDVIRKVAIEKNVNLLDIEYVFHRLNRESVLADDVHPNPTGYNAIGKSYCELTKTNFIFNESALTTVHEDELFIRTEIPGGSANTDISGDMVDIESIEFNKPYGKRGFIADVKLNCANTRDIESQYDLILVGHSRPNQQGDATNEVILDQTYISVIGEGSKNRAAIAILKGHGEFGSSVSYRVILRGSDYRFRNVGAISFMSVVFI